MLLQLALTLTLASVALGAGNRCCAPKQWQGQQVRSKGYSDGRTSGQFAEVYDVAYDADNQKVAKVGKRFHKDEIIDYKIIEDYQSGKMYRINLGTEDCEVKSLGKKFEEMCVPESAKRLDRSYFGAGDNSLVVVAYEMKVQDGETDVVAVPVMAFLDNDICVPVTEDISGKFRGNGIYTNVNTFGIKTGISDPTVFDPPSYCSGKQASGEDFLATFSVTIPGGQRSKPKNSLMDLVKDTKLYF